ncbi:allantoinase PuuE [Fulvimarina sp. MAC8]|uniref:allantoinase PuuE n=1 Tax=Fulvimarina sp. MAC8 TaxID=3162874 RepID=UPI0032EBB915
MTAYPYPRDLIGYGGHPPDPQWPNPNGSGPAKICVQFVVNYEEGGENAILHGDKASEAFLSEIVGASAWEGQRHMNMESIYEYGARAGFWRLHRMFTERGLPVTVYGVATALARNPAAVAAMQEAGWEIASHGLKWIEYKDFDRDAERGHMAAAIAIHEAVTGEKPKGWYTGRSSVHTLELAAENGGLAYASDAYADDLPYWQETETNPLLVIPYTLDTNDMRFATPQGFNSGEQYFTFLKDAFDTLYEEGEAGQAKMLNIGLHCRLVGRPSRAAALAKFLDYVQSKPDVWVAKRIEIAEHWRSHFPYKARFRPSRMEREAFVSLFGGVYEHSPFIAERVYDFGLSPAFDTAETLTAGMAREFRLADEGERQLVLQAHPDLAGKLAVADDLTEDSRAEQAGAGLDRLSEAEFKRFTEFNTAYRTRFGFPFIIAVKGKKKDDILAAFETRLENNREAEFNTACREVEQIAAFRIAAIFENNHAGSPAKDKT